jgi:hypothetical protein
MRLNKHQRRIWWFVAWRGGGTLAVAGVLAYFDRPSLALWWVAGSALFDALLALQGVIRLENRFPETE